MSSKIYFTEQNKQRSVQFHLTQVLSGFASRVCPKLTQKYVEKLLMTPVRHNAKQPIPKAFKSEVLSTAMGDIHLVSAGNGPIIVMTHGWSGSASQFYPLMNYLVQLGFKVVAFDHYAHGKSTGELANLPKFIKGLNFVLDSIKEPVSAIVSHSMGSIAALNTHQHAITHILIAPPFDFYTGFKARILATGLSETLFHKLVTSIEREHQVQFHALLPERHIGLFKRITVIHDKDDKFADHDLSFEQTKLHPQIQMHSTQGLGHGRILGSEKVWQQISSVLQTI